MAALWLIKTALWASWLVDSLGRTRRMLAAREQRRGLDRKREERTTTDE